MENKIEKHEKRRSSLRIDFDTAHSLLTSKFLELHPKETHPRWLSRLLPPAIRFDDKNGQVFLTLGAYKKDDLDLNYYWKEKDGRRDLIWINPRTGNEMIAITYTPKEYIKFFEAVLDVETLELAVLIDMDFAVIASEELDGF